MLLRMLVAASLAASPGLAQDRAADAGSVVLHGDGLHGYISFHASQPPSGEGYGAGVSFYSAAWSLIDRPLAGFQCGLASTWILPDNADNKDKPLAPVGTLARTWPERGPTWDSVFQTVEGGLGYWAGNHFRYGPPKFSMNATPQCYDYEIGSPGWSFFYSNEALPDERLGIAQLSNRLLIPPDGLPFEDRPDGQLLGYAWMALPFSDASVDDPPTGDQSWTCFLSAANFRGPIAYYIPEIWSKIGKIFHEPFLHGRGLDARPGRVGGGAIEINTVPHFESRDARGVTYSKIPKLQFPVDERGRTLLIQDVKYYSKAAIFDAFRTWCDGGATCAGQFDAHGAWSPRLEAVPTIYDLSGRKMTGVAGAFENQAFGEHEWGLQWTGGNVSPRGVFPQYYRHDGDERVAVSADQVPRETRLHDQEFPLAGKGAPYTSPAKGAWSNPGPRGNPLTVQLADGSVVTYAWYRFIDQPSLQQYGWSTEKKARLQALVEKIHATWPIDREFIAPPKRGA